MRDPSVRRLALGFALLTAFTYGLIVLGALVRSHGAGLACPDWPLCFGDFVPEFDLRVAFEWSHRVVAGAISLSFLATGLATLRRPVARRAVAPLLAVGAALLAVQILLGALTVWHLLASWTVTSHLVTGNAFMLCLALTSRRLFRVSAGRVEEDAGNASPGLRAGLAAVGALLAVQIVLGGLVSSKYAGLACPEWPSCLGGVWFPSFEGALGVHLLHRLGAYALVVGIGACAFASREVARLRPLLYLAAALVVAQAGVGVANVLLRLPVEVTGLHSAVAAALVLTLALSIDESWQRS